jgi:hypothetical protein
MAERNTHIRRRSCDRELGRAESFEERSKVRPIERRVAALEHDRLAGAGRHLQHEVAALSFGGSPEELRHVHAGPVIRVDDGGTLVPRRREELHEPRVPQAEAGEETVAVLVLEVLQHVDEKQSLHPPSSARSS